MKPNALLARLAHFCVPSLIFLAVSGCASSNETGGNGKRALVCPQCKMVSVKIPAPLYRSGSRHGLYPGDKQVYYKDTCPGCQGAIETFFKEGKLKHTCSICKDSPFVCPINHPTSN